MRALAPLALALLLGCSPRDPCAGLRGSCLALEVQGVGEVDQLSIAASGALAGTRLVPATPRRAALPVSVAVHSAALAQGSVALTVTGLLAGREVGVGAVVAQLGADHRGAATVRLAPRPADQPLPDGGCAGDLAPCAGGCVDLASDDAHCGACGTACPADTACRAGACACTQAGRGLCAGACVALDSDPANCGVCGNACPPGTDCTGGACACGGGLVGCFGHCVDVSSDAAHCGGCGHACVNGGCQAGQCTCGAGLALCGSTCADLQSDPTNCGRCGHACGAGSCQAGRCVAEIQEVVRQFAGTAPGEVYWLGNAIEKAPVSGGSPIVLASLSNVANSSAALGPLGIYYTDGPPADALSVVSLDGGAPALLAQSSYQPTLLCLDSSSIYFTDLYGNLSQLPLGGGAVSPLASGLDPLAMASDGTTLVWINQDLTSFVWTVQAMSVSGGPVTTLARLDQRVLSVLVWSGAAYWTDPIAGDVWRIDLNGQNQVQVATGQSLPVGPVTDGTTLFWVNSGSNDVMQLPLAGGSPSVLVHSDRQLTRSGRGLMVDATHLFVATENNTSFFIFER